MRRPVIVAMGLLLAVFVTQIAVSPAGGAPQDDPVATALSLVTRATRWEQVGTIDLQFDAEHPQGMVKLGDRFFISSVEIIEPTPPGGCSPTSGSARATCTTRVGSTTTAGGYGCRSRSTGRTRMRSSTGSTPTALPSKRSSGSGTTSQASCGTGATVTRTAGAGVHAGSTSGRREANSSSGA